MEKIRLNADKWNDRFVINFFRIICVIEVILIGYFNLIKLRYYCEYDSSSYFLKAYEMYRQGTLFISDWVDQTSLYFDSPVPLAALLMNIFHNIFLSYGLANCMITAANIYLFHCILKDLDFPEMSRLIVLAFFLCPYLTTPFDIVNDLGYYSCLFVSAGFYSVKILISLMYLLSMERLLHAGRKNAWMLLTVIGLFVSGMSSGYHLAMYAVIPGCVYAVWYFWTNRERKDYFSIILYNAACMAALVIGKLIQSHVFQYKSREDVIAWIGLEDLWDNFISILLGNLLGINALPRESNVTALSAEGVAVVLGLLMAVVFVAGIVYACRRKVYKKTAYMFFIAWGAVNALLLLLINSRYGDPVFETRYMLPCIITEMVVIAGAICLNNSGYRNFIIGMVGILISCNVIYSVVNYSGIENNYDELKEVTAEIDKLDAPVVYVYGDSMENGEKRAVRAFDTNKTYIVMTDMNAAYKWGDITRYCDNSDWDGPTILLTTQLDYYSLPEFMQLKYNKVWENDEYAVFYSDTNIMDLESGTGDRDYAIDFPYSKDATTGLGEYDETGKFVSDGSRGWVLAGPKLETDHSGYYDFALNYTIDAAEQTDSPATFSIVYSVVGEVEEVVQTVELKKNENRAVLESFYLDKAESGNYNYRVYCSDGTIITIDSIEIYRRDR